MIGSYYKSNTFLRTRFFAAGGDGKVDGSAHVVSCSHPRSNPDLDEGREGVKNMGRRRYENTKNDGRSLCV
jgi:hypothetical protein